MESRIYNLRKSLRMSQEKFGDKIGLTGAGISKIESGDRGVTDSIFKLICSTFNVSEDWLKTGEGEMFNTNEDDELAYLIGGLFAEESPFKRRFIKAILKLDEAQWADVKNFAKMLSVDED